MKLKGKVAVITGGNSGIGLAIAKDYAAQGASVVISGRNKKTLDEAAASIGNDTLAVQGDVSNLADLDSLFQKVAERHKTIDILVANAGIAAFTPIDQVSEKAFDEISDINFKGLFFTVQKAVPLLNKGASVILVSSIANQVGMNTFSVYSATKAAVRSLSRTLSAELLPKGIRVNTLSPGPIETPLFDRMGMTKEMQTDFGKQITSKVPMGRFGSSEEMAKAATFLASSDSSYVAGAEIVADGGMSQI